MHSKESRNLLYFNSSGMPPVLVGEILNAGWNVKVTDNVGGAARIIDQYAPHVAIAQFDGLNDSLGRHRSKTFSTMWSVSNGSPCYLRVAWITVTLSN